jgi:hypothetical protein
LCASRGERKNIPNLMPLKAVAISAYGPSPLHHSQELTRICGRPRLHPEFLIEMQDWLLRAGWAFFFAGRSFGMIKLEAVETWTRLGSKRIADELDAVARGTFDFASLAQLAERDLSAQDD